MRYLFLAPFFISLTSLAQIDSLLLVKKSRIQFCLDQNYKVTIFTEQMIVKDSMLVIKDKRIETKDSIIVSKNRDIEAYKDQIGVLQATIPLKDNDIAYYKAKYRQERVKGILKNVIIGGLIVIDIAVIVVTVIAGQD